MVQFIRRRGLSEEEVYTEERFARSRGLPGGGHITANFIMI